jgi:Tol biopolymer transport system component
MFVQCRRIIAVMIVLVLVTGCAIPASFTATPARPVVMPTPPTNSQAAPVMPTPVGTPVPTMATPVTATPRLEPTATTEPALPAAQDNREGIAFYSQRDGRTEIYVIDSDGGNLRRLTDNGAGDMAPAVSPDGRRIAFTTNRDGNNEIYVMNADGSDPQRLTNNSVYESHPAWAPDGSRIAFVSDRDGNREIYVMDADGTNPRRLTDHPAEDMRPTWSPDSQQIAFNSDRDGNWEIYSMRSDGSDLHRLTDSPTWEIFPAWSPDGTQIAYRHSVARGWNGDIWVMDADGDNKQQLTHEPSNDENPSWSPDGSQIVFQSDRYADPRTMGSDTYNFELLIMDADGGNARRLTDHPAGDYWPTWGSPANAAVTTESQITPTTIAHTAATGDTPVTAGLVIDVPLGSPPILDGVLEPSEWAGALQDKLSDGGGLFLMQDGETLYVGIRASAKGSGVGNICIDRGEQVAILHSSAALGTAIYEKDGAEWQQIQDFSWRCRNTGSSAAAQEERSEFLQAEGWLANNGRMGVPEEVEYQIAMPEGSLRLAVSFLGPPGFDSVAAWPQDLGDDCQNIRLVTGPVPERLKFSPQTWMTVSPAGTSTLVLAPISVTTAAQVEKLHILSGHGGSTVSLRFLPDGLHLMSLGGDVSLKLWDVTTGQEVRSHAEQGDTVYNAAFSPDGTLLAVERPGHEVQLRDTESGQVVHNLGGHTEFVMGLAFSPDGALLATADGRGMIKVWAVATGQAIHTLAGHTSPVRALAFSSDAALLASGSVEGSQVIKLWDIESGQELRTLTGHTDNVYSLAFSPDDRRLASASGDRTLKLWDVESGQEVRAFRGHPDRIYSVAYSPDGTALASGSFDGTIKLWDVETGQELHTLRGHTDLVEPLIFSADGSLLASGSFDAAVILWGIPR